MVLETWLLSFAFWQSDVILLINFQLSVHIQNTPNWCCFLINFFASAKIWPTTRSHLKGTNALHPATSKLLAKTGNFQGLAPVYKELLVKACNRKCTFLPRAKNYDSWKSEKHSEGKSQKSEFSCLLPSTSHNWWLHLGLNVHPASLCNLSNVFSSRELTATAWAAVVLGKLQLLYAASF